MHEKVFSFLVPICVIMLRIQLGPLGDKWIWKKKIPTHAHSTWDLFAFYT